MTADDREGALAAHGIAVSACVSCRLCESRSQVVAGVGLPSAEVMLVGEAPGFHEDRTGLPFAGREADLVDRLLALAGLERGQVYCTTVVKCRPAGSGEPTAEEISACEPHLYRELELVRPRVVVTLGTLPTRLLTGRSQTVADVRGEPQRHVIAGRELTVLPVYRPAAARYAPERAAELEADFGGIPGLLGRDRLAVAGLAEQQPVPVAVAPAPPGEQLGLF
ncbi:MAG: uracil-DNA glycosylase [Gaiellales bacterium]